jgi:hypothetical protein
MRETAQGIKKRIIPKMVIMNWISKLISYWFIYKIFLYNLKSIINQIILLDLLDFKKQYYLLSLNIIILNIKTLIN